jgi:hypothetical protein
LEPLTVIAGSAAMPGIATTAMNAAPRNMLNMMATMSKCEIIECLNQKPTMMLYDDDEGEKKGFS